MLESERGLNKEKPEALEPERGAKREWFKITVAAAVFLADSKGRLLLVRHYTDKGSPRWGPPADKVNPREDPRMSARRTTKQELGVDVKLLDLVGIFPVDRHGRTTGYAFVFRGEILGGQSLPKGDETAKYAFFSPMQIDALKKAGELYKPEYNIRAIRNWQRGDAYNLDVIKSLKSIP